MPAAARVLADLMGLLEVENVNHAPPAFQTRALSDLNGGLQETYSLAPTEWFSTDDRGDAIRAPTAVTLTCTAGSKTVTFAGYASWMLGCTIIISGDANQNQLVSVSSSISLRLPYGGSTGSQTATVYHDKLQIDAEAFEVVTPVTLLGNYPLLPVASRRDLAAAIFGCGDYGSGNGTGWGNTGYTLGFASIPPKSIQAPRLFLVERSAPYAGTTTLALTFDSLPDKAYTIQYSVQLKSPVVTTFSDTREYLVPFSYEATILLPMVRYRFSSWPQAAFSKQDTAQEYQAAVAMLKGLNPAGYQVQAMAMQC